MFGLRKTERAAYEAHIASLQEQVHWLRSCIPWVVPSGPTGATANLGGAAPPPLAVTEPLDDLPVGLHMSEEEEDIVDAVHRGDLDVEEAKAILRTLGLNDEIQFA